MFIIREHEVGGVCVWQCRGVGMREGASPCSKCRGEEPPTFQGQWQWYDNYVRRTVIPVVDPEEFQRFALKLAQQNPKVRAGGLCFISGCCLL